MKDVLLFVLPLGMRHPFVILNTRQSKSGNASRRNKYKRRCRSGTCASVCVCVYVCVCVLSCVLRVNCVCPVVIQGLARGATCGLRSRVLLIITILHREWDGGVGWGESCGLQWRSDLGGVLWRGVGLWLV